MIVLDASAAVAMSLERPEGKRLRGLLLTGELVTAPELFLAEVDHVFEKYARGGHMSSHEAAACAKRTVSLVDELKPMSELCVEALNESLRLEHSSYGLFYLVLARRLGATLFTIDKRLSRLCLKNGVSCICDLDVEDEAWTVRCEQEGSSRP